MRLTREQVEKWRDVATHVLAMLPPLEGHLGGGGSVEKIHALTADWLEMDDKLREFVGERERLGLEAQREAMEKSEEKT